MATNFFGHRLVPPAHMYHDYFGLKEPAFSIAVNPKYLYMSAQHKEALAHLVYGVQGGGFVLLSGEVGTGKTTIIRCLLEQLPDNTEIAFVLNPMANVEEMLSTICEELNIPIDNNSKSIKVWMDALQQRLLDNYASGKRTVLLIDEAQLLSVEVLEQIRLLTNLETSSDKLLQIVLVGQPEVNGLLAQPRLRQLSQRITARFHLQALSLDETQLYINHRLHVAGKKEARRIFPKHIVKKIHRFSGGIPRLINIICERLLVGAYGHNKYEVDTQIYRLAIQEVEGVKTGATQAPPKASNLLGLIFAPIAAIALIWITVTTILPTLNLSSAPELNTQMSDARVEKIPGSSETLDANPVNSASLNRINNPFSAYARLFNYHNIILNTENHPCWQTALHNMSCSEVEFQTWEQIEELNRPIILTLLTEEKSLAYAVLAGIDADRALLVNENNSLEEVSRQSLTHQWTGNVIYLWRKPTGYDAPLSVGAVSPVVSWVAKQLAVIDGQSIPITQSRFTSDLQARIKIFQLNNLLEADGVIGERTLMKLNEQLGITTTLIRNIDSVAQG